MSYSELFNEMIALRASILGPPLEFPKAWASGCLATSAGPWNLFWRFARAGFTQQKNEPEEAYHKRVRECQATVESFHSKEIETVIDNQMPGLEGEPGIELRLFRATIWCIHAAAQSLTQNDQVKFGEILSHAAAEYEYVFAGAEKGVLSPTGSIGRSIAESVVQRLLGQSDTKSACGTWFLLAGANPKQAVRLVAELEPGPTGQLLPDPLRLGCIRLKSDFLASVTDAWTFVQKHWRCPTDCRVVWGIERHQSIRIIDGPSGGAALGAVFRGAVENVPLDAGVAVSATLFADGSVGKVEQANTKRIAASSVGCVQVCFHPKTKLDESTTQENENELPDTVTVETFEDAWNALSAMEIHVRNYQNHWRAHFENQWSNAAELREYKKT